VASNNGCQQVGSNSTCNAFADALLGNFSNYQEASADPIGHFRFTQPEAFVQDTWKASRKLSLEYGVRWQGIYPFYTQANNISNFDPRVYDPTKAVTVTTGGRIVPGSGNPYNGLVRAGDGVPSDQTGRVPNVNTSIFPLIPNGGPRGLYQMHGNFGPRLGFAYNPRTNTVIRGGIGEFFFRPEGNLIFSQLNLPPFLSNTQYDFGNLATVSAGAVNNTGLQATVTGIDPRMKNPYTYQYSLGVQQQFPKGLFVELNYVGNAAHHLLRQPNINYPDLAQTGTNTSNNVNFYNPYKGFAAINQNLSDSNSNYNSLQIYAAKRTGMLTFTVSYTFAKNLGDSAENNVSLENWRDLNYNYGPTSNDRRQALVATYILQAPELRGHNFLVREAVGGWQLSGVLRLQSGAYYNVTSSTAVSTRRADRNPAAPLYASHRTANCYVLAATSGCGSPSAAPFSAPPATRFGNSGAGAIIGPGLAQSDMSLAKYFPIRESVRVKFQGDVFNALNRTNYSTLNLVTTSSNFGTLSAAYPPRQIQLALKLLF
jgi:hypothetical protein